MSYFRCPQCGRRFDAEREELCPRCGEAIPPGLRLRVERRQYDANLRTDKAYSRHRRKAAARAAASMPRRAGAVPPGSYARTQPETVAPRLSGSYPQQPSTGGLTPPNVPGGGSGRRRRRRRRRRMLQEHPMLLLLSLLLPVILLALVLLVIGRLGSAFGLFDLLELLLS